VKYRQNQINDFENQKNSKNYTVLSEDEFIAQHGDKPWEVINSILKKFSSIHYQINSPEGSDIFSNYELKLVHPDDKNLQIDFNSLSSGEKVLMALVASVYKSSFDRFFPDLLLLDEIDATLHPSMMKNMIEVLQEEFLKRGTKIILVTHSPTTVAFAPDESIYVMQKEGKNRLQKTTNAEALSILTEGFAILQDGLRIFDQISKLDVAIITEGKNTTLLNKCFELYGITDIEIITGVESSSGKNQLKTLFDFFCRVEHKKKVLFIWDCDVNFQLESINNTIPIIIERNSDNRIAKNGIENAFPELLFNDFQKKIIRSNGETLIEFDESRKRDFEKYVIDRNQKSDFKYFEGILTRIKEYI
jgi:energy-coupling factor transporter ATP-binding protein EcfA2